MGDEDGGAGEEIVIVYVGVVGGTRWIKEGEGRVAISCGMQTDATEIACTRERRGAGVGKHGEVVECCQGCQCCQTVAGMTGDRCRRSVFD